MNELPFIIIIIGVLPKRAKKQAPGRSVLMRWVLWTKTSCLGVATAI